MSTRTNPKYPVCIISKGRWESRLTVKALERIGVPYKIFVEPPEYDDYAAVIDPENIITLSFANLGQGSIPARNFVWDYAVENDTGRHWILDDNISWFYRLNHNRKTPVNGGNTFRAIEEFTDRYTNIALAGMQYDYFVPRKEKWPPLILNTRIYSCILIKNDLPFRWRGKYNEDTDLSLRALKAGWCTVLFNAFPCKKITTMMMKGGNTDNVYTDGDERLKFAQSLAKQHPDVVKIVRKYGRWHHQVDYRPFKKNKFVKKPDVVIPEGTDDFGMKLVKVR
ncbi:MAG: hypothetical protein IBX61_09735 [Thermoleophilia bacterium]|nr:hypothetical protein [Thermoleophilia bacterium]